MRLKLAGQSMKSVAVDRLELALSRVRRLQTLQVSNGGVLGMFDEVGVHVATGAASSGFQDSFNT